MNTIDKKAIVKFLREVSIMTAALIGEKGPISTPLLFAVENDLSKLYFATHRNSFKAQAIKKHPVISSSIWQFNQLLVQLDGTVKEVTDKDKITAILNKLVTSLSHLEDFWPPILQIEGDGYVVFEISPTWIRALDLSNKNIISGDNPFTEIQL